MAWRQIKVYATFDDQRLRVGGPGFARPFECRPCAAVEATREGRTVRAVGERALGLADEPGIQVIHPFAHPRVAVSEFTVASTLLQHALRNLLGRLWLRRVGLILHPLRQLEGGLTDIETRALMELGTAAGAHRVAIVTGQELGARDVAAFAFG